ncbi:hypothetical protein FG93_01012 [Bosea sp. LC85]|uniref:hypothetical protein n=1 Tax=Bosea sp. LC85 TaxID=1502851 RepID=UPI0004E3E97F|nr:hypothetical protein [Bosea sp. LC85]KFC74833.1 hypothetical protein FG93_01012 [Bosea sp. LC85]
MEAFRGKVVITILGLIVSTVQSSAQQSANNLKSMVFFKGRCSTFTIGPQRYTCDKMFYTQFSNGRIAFNIALPGGAIMLSGGKDSQIDPARYVLEIDTIRTGNDKGESQSYKAKGQCRVHMSGDGEFVKTVSCRANNGMEAVNIEFKGDGSRVDKKFF